METDLLAKWPDTGARDCLASQWRGGHVSRSRRGRSSHYDVEFSIVVRWLRHSASRMVQLLWTAPVAANYENSMGNGPRATPTIAGQQVFAYTGEGILA